MVALVMIMVMVVVIIVLALVAVMDMVMVLVMVDFPSLVIFSHDQFVEIFLPAARFSSVVVVCLASTYPCYLYIIET
jgi:hypothetical protein